ncbi:hypothetical protein ACJMK2_008138 [Sinanodonta woodiana]|uniref:Cytochrome P450 n=1 Tax=Sinanodonta woodiana TaxID=1069815 RepID=A0ABD3VNX8_SINWO
MEADGLLRNWTESISRILTVAVIAFFGYAIYKIVIFVAWYQNLHSVFNRVQGPSDYHWLDGNTKMLQDCPDTVKLNFIMGLMKKYPRYFRLWEGPFTPSIVVYDVDIARQILQTPEEKNTGFSGIYRFLIPWLGRSLLTSGGIQWKRARHQLTPAFHSKILMSYITIYNDAANLLIKKLIPHADSGNSVEVFQAVRTCALEIVMRCALSYHIDCRKQGKIQAYLKAVQVVKDTVEYRHRCPILYPDCIFYLTKRGREFSKHCKFLHDFADDVVNSRKKKLEKEDVSNNKYMDLVDVLLTSQPKTGDGFTSVEIRDQVNNFLSAGHDSTSSAISWILYSIAEHQDVQDKIKAEVDGVLEGRQTDDLRWEDLPRLEYLEMVIKEGMRQHCPIPCISRQITKAFQIDGYQFPAGTSVAIDIYMLHHNEELWERPSEFIPERFSRENASKIKPFQFIPFSAGPRNCIGQNFAMNEQKVVLAKLIHRFKFMPKPNHIPRKKASIVMRSFNGIMLNISSR